jgi:hypothetical protein
MAKYNEEKKGRLVKNKSIKNMFFFLGYKKHEEKKS